jgi:peptidylprolyl isomerase/peptidyl-prolyl cis-trans isomerase D
MAILSKIRERSLALIAVIGLALFAFVLDPSTLTDFFSASKVNEIGEINGETISREEFANDLESYKRQTGNRVSEMQAAQTVWNNLVRKKIYQKQLSEAGITIGEADVWGEVVEAQKTNAQFLNEAGLFDEGKLKQFLATTKENDPNLWSAWENYMNQISDNAERNTYNSLISAGLGASLKEGETQYFNENTKMSAQYVYVPYTTVADSLVKITRSEIDSYVKAHKNDFKVEASRDISYVKFDITPTQSDEEAIKNEVAKLIEDKQEYSNVTKSEETVKGLKNSENLTDFFNENGSDINLDETFKFKNNVSKEVADAIFAGNKGDVFGPYKEAGLFKVSKITEVASMPDSVRASHILIPFVGAQRAAADVTRTEEQAKKMADSLLVVLKRRGSKFAALAKELSSDKGSGAKGGDLDWFNYGRMTPEFRDYAFNGKKRDMDVVKTPFGFHIIKIDDQKNNQTVVKLATFGRTIVASEATENAVFQDAEKFALGVSKENKFFDVAKESNYNTKSAVGLKVLDENVPGLGNQRLVISWAFNKDAKNGDFKRFDLDNGHIVVTLTGKTEDGLMSAEKATGSVRPILANKKKASIIKGQLNGSTLAELATSVKTSVKTASALNLKSPTISGVGNEPKIVGAMFNAKENELYSNIEGDKGVFAFVVSSKELPTALPNYDPIRTQISQTRKSQTNKMYEAIKKASDIEDNRASFYGIN